MVDPKTHSPASHGGSHRRDSRFRAKIGLEICVVRTLTMPRSYSRCDGQRQAQLYSLVVVDGSSE